MASFDVDKAIRFALTLKADPFARLALIALARHKGEYRTVAEVSAELALGNGGIGRASSLCMDLVRKGFVVRDKPNKAFAIMKDHPALRGVAVPAKKDMRAREAKAAKANAAAAKKAAAAEAKAAKANADGAEVGDAE